MENMRFEDALKRLEAVVAELEAGKVSLDDSLALYEEGMKLIRLCNGRLDAAEQRVDALRLTEEGAFLEPFGVDKA